MEALESFFLYIIIVVLTLLLGFMSRMFSNWEIRRTRSILALMMATHEAIDKVLAYHASNYCLVYDFSYTIDSEFEKHYISYKRFECDLICRIERIIPKENRQENLRRTLNLNDTAVNIRVLKDNKVYLENVIAVSNTIQCTYCGIKQKRLNAELFKQWYYYYAPLWIHNKNENSEYHLINTAHN